MDMRSRLFELSESSCIVRRRGFTASLRLVREPACVFTGS